MASKKVNENNKTKSGGETNKQKAKNNKINLKRKPVKKLSERNELKFLNAKNQNYKNQITTKTKNSQRLKSNLEQAVFKKKQKEFLTDQKGGSLKEHYNPEYNFSKAEGILKTSNCYKSAKNHANVGIKGNVIGKKSNIKVIASKALVASNIILIIIVALSILSNFLIYSYFKFKIEQPLFTVTKPIQLEIQESGTFITNVTVPHCIIPNSNIKQEIKVYSLLLKHNSVLRMKGTFSTADKEVFKLKLTTTNDWQFNEEDDYYYYNKPVGVGEVIKAVNSFDIPEEFDLDINGKEMHVASFVFETLPHNYSTVTNVWTTANPNWLNEIFI